MKKTLNIKIILIISSLFLSLILTELLLRLLNFKPWQYGKLNTTSDVFFEPDPMLGWVSKKGNYKFTFNDDLISEVDINIEEDSNRTTGIKSKNKKNILIIGGSFTQGWGVNDRQTYPFLLQQMFKKYNIYNFAQSGYGGFQSLLLIEEKIKEKNPLELIIYGFIEHHEQRNVAREDWLETLLKYSNKSQKFKIKVPYATLNKNNVLVYNKPIGYLELPLREQLAFVNLLEKFYMHQFNRTRKKIQKKVTEKIFLELNELAKKNNAKFLVANLHYSNKNTAYFYEKFLNDNKINYVDCAINLNAKLILKGDFHPNAAGHKMYSDCIGNYLTNKSFF